MSLGVDDTPLVSNGIDSVATDTIRYSNHHKPNNRLAKLGSFKKHPLSCTD